MRRILCILAATLGLAACTGRAEVAGPVLSYRFHGSDITGVNRQATQDCARRQRAPAYLEAVTRDGQDNVAVYQCGS